MKNLHRKLFVVLLVFFCLIGVACRDPDPGSSSGSNSSNYSGKPFSPNKPFGPGRPYRPNRPDYFGNFDNPSTPNIPDNFDIPNPPDVPDVPDVPDTPDVPDVPTSFDMTAAEFVAGMTIGWNLGNTFDSGAGETAWGNPTTTQAMIDTLKNAGFNTIRIPVTWTGNSFPSSPWYTPPPTGGANSSNDYTINTNFMNRVKAVVDYAVNNDMYILLNTHHDEGTFKFTEANKAASLIAFEKVWQQIADAFKDYDEKLIFEGLNEPRTKGSAKEWSGGTTEEHNVLNEHYQLFVDTVRASGGNNDKRFLSINTYAGSAEQVAMNGLILPNDSAADKLIVQLHAYSPWEFALKTDEPYETTWSATNSSSKNGPSGIRSVFDRAYNTYVSKGIPVIIGEFGAVDRSSIDENNVQSRIDWVEFYTGYARSKGIPCVLWDNGQFVFNGDNEVFGFFDRRNNTFPYPEYKDALLRGAGVELNP